MSIVHEIHRQHPAVRRALFLMSMVITVSTVGFFTFSSIQQTVYFGMHPDPAEQQAFLEKRDAARPHPVAAITKAAGSLVASIGSLIGWKSDAGFDNAPAADNTQDAVHLLPVAQ